MVGINNGVYSKLNQENTSLILMQCVCDSMQLAMSYASAECIPSNFEYLFAETHNWFAKSSVRQYQYHEFYKAINDGSEPRKILSDCKTRWKYIQPAVENVITHLLELKAHLNIERLSEKCYSVELSIEMSSDEKNPIILTFFAINHSRCARNK